MRRSHRRRFILSTTLLYGLSATLWVFLSDRLFSTMMDVEAIERLSLTKGLAFVALTTVLLFLALRSVPAPNQPTVSDLQETETRSLPRWIFHGVAAGSSVVMLVLHHTAASLPPHQPLLILLLFPVILSGGLGGLGPGLLATVIVAAGAAMVAVLANAGTAFTAPANLLQWGFLITNGVLVSVVSERLRRAQMRALALRNVERNFRVLFDNIATSVFIHDRDSGEIISANSRAIERSGCASLAELQQNEFWADPPYSGADALVLIRKAAAEGPLRFEWLNQTHDGQVFWEDVSLNTIMFDDVERVVAIATDITARKAAEAAQHRLGEALRQSAQPILLTDAETRITYVNPAFTRLMGYGEDELVGRPVDCLWPPGAESRSQQLQLIGQLRGDGVWNGELSRLAKDGTLIPLYANVAVLRSNDNAIEGLIAEYQDLRQIKQTEKNLRERNEELDRFNRAMVGRELDMIALKRQVNLLSRQLGLPPPYRLDAIGAALPAGGEE